MGSGKELYLKFRSGISTFNLSKATSTLNKGLPVRRSLSEGVWKHKGYYVVEPNNYSSYLVIFSDDCDAEVIVYEVENAFWAFAYIAFVDQFSSISYINMDVQNVQSPTTSNVPSFGTKSCEIDTKLASFDKRITKLEAWKDLVRNDKSQLKQDVEYTERKVNNLADYNRRNCLEIHGIPEENNEDLSERVIELGKTLGVEIQTSHYDALPQRLPTRSGIKPIIVRFVNQYKREELMNAQKKKWVKVDEDGFEEIGKISGSHKHQLVYINNSLTPGKKYLAMKARIAFKEKGYNVWSLKAKEGTKLDGIKSSIDNQRQIHFIALCETWLMEHDDKYFKLSGYRDRHLVRVNQRGGGVSVYVKDSIKIIEQKVIEREVQVMVLKTKIKKEIWNLIVVYNPHKEFIHQCLNELEAILMEVGNTNTVIVGGFNLDIQLASTIERKIGNTFTHTDVAKDFSLRGTSEEEIKLLIRKLSNKSSSPKSLHNNLLKKFAITLVPTLSQLVNLSFKEGIFHVMPVHKQGDPCDPGNYRPISILSGSSRLHGGAMKNRLEKHLEDIKFHYDAQYGFRKDKDLQCAVFDFVIKVQIALDRNKYASVVFIDLKKAFDTVDHNILLSRLEKNGVKNKALQWFKSYLGQRPQQVKLCNFLSSILEILRGVPQGSILGTTFVPHIHK
ncbi:hypothetical protein ONE63_005168 [Megalurothrips usitatus]|uniref:Reverse transcriptase domain-containing protein n=1 Tax=Megalurothrips usitatus TaxID=439358 RepID=A0AAV7XVK2_9NEOP|nr:hypothetical protein ONE63_005168 [Megalurothrips usitatus]